MIGAIVGDVIGSVHEWHRAAPDFELLNADCTFTDDTVLTVATAHAILHDVPYDVAYREIGQRYPNSGWGGNFLTWLFSTDPKPYNSWGNGSAMRVSPVGFACETEERVLAEAERSAAVTHNHPEGVKGAQATALAVFLARTGSTKNAIRERIQLEFGYNLDRSVEDIRPHYSYDVSCQGSVPEAIVAFLDSTSFQDAISLAISLGGDADTQAAIAGGIAQAFYGGVPAPLATFVRDRLPAEFCETIDAFTQRYPDR